MKRLILTTCAVFIAAICSTIAAQSEAEMKAWMNYMTPGDFHKEMAKWDGEWNEDITMWMAPGKPAQKKYSILCKQNDTGWSLSIINTYRFI